MKIRIICLADFDGAEHTVTAYDATPRLEDRILGAMGHREMVRIENATFDGESRPRTVQIRGTGIRRIEVDE